MNIPDGDGGGEVSARKSPHSETPKRHSSPPARNENREQSRTDRHLLFIFLFFNNVILPCFAERAAKLDPHGADGNGSPIGGLVFSNVWGEYRQIHEWTNFVSFESLSLLDNVPHCG